MSSAGFMVNVTILLIEMRLLGRERAGGGRLLRLVHDGRGAQEARGIDADRVDPELGEKTRDLGVIRGRLATDPDVTMVALGAGHRESQHFEHARITLIEIEGDDL